MATAIAPSQALMLLMTMSPACTWNSFCHVSESPVSVGLWKMPLPNERAPSSGYSPSSNFGRAAENWCDFPHLYPFRVRTPVWNAERRAAWSSCSCSSRSFWAWVRRASMASKWATIRCCSASGGKGFHLRKIVTGANARLRCPCACSAQLSTDFRLEPTMQTRDQICF